jgi:RimJ/RimL family protein N-acetyltransferase
MLRHGFEDLHLSAIWGDHNLENHKSERVMDKLGLRHIRVAEHEQLKQLGEVYRDMAVRCITAEQWAAGKA